MFKLGLLTVVLEGCDDGTSVSQSEASLSLVFIFSQ